MTSMREEAAWTEPKVRAFLTEQGIPCGDYRFAATAKEAARAAGEIGFPVALKVVSAQISHKSDAGGVKLSLGTAQAVEGAYEDIMASCSAYDPKATVDGVIVTPMSGNGVEVIAGIARDPQFGPVLMVGLGGVLVEVLKDVSFRVAPATERDVRAMLAELKGYRLLEGFRGSGPADVDALVSLLVRLSRLPFAPGPRIKELDLNPIRVFGKGKGLAILDARMAAE